MFILVGPVFQYEIWLYALELDCCSFRFVIHLFLFLGQQGLVWTPVFTCIWPWLFHCCGL